jgi:phosphatidylserine synthase
VFRQIFQKVFFFAITITFLFFLCSLLWFVKYNFQIERAHPQVLSKDGNE